MDRVDNFSIKSNQQFSQVGSQGAGDITPHDKHILINLPNGNIKIAEKIEPIPREKLMCYQCRVILEHARGAKYVKCMKCQAINQVPKPKFERKNCLKCRVILQFPLNSRRVKCGMCQYVNNFS